MLDKFYTSDNAMNLLDNQKGEKVVFIGLRASDNGMYLDRYVYKNSMKVKEIYFLNDTTCEVKLLSVVFLTINVSFDTYRPNYNTLVS